MAELAPHRSACANCGCNGCDAQLDRLGEQLATPTHQKKQSFLPEDGVVLENNALAPVLKKHHSRARIILFSGSLN